MLVPFAKILTEARAQRRAAGGFTAYDLVTGHAILRAASDRHTGVIVIISAQAFAAPTGGSLVAGLRAMSAEAPVPVCLQLDHVSDLDAMQLALMAGVGAIMADGSKLPYDQNLALVREAGRLAEAYGAAVEAELGRIEGDEEVAMSGKAEALTDPAQASEFMAATSGQCLAVSIGNVHGAYQSPPDLDWQRLSDISSLVQARLSLHGASGIPDRDVRRAIRQGVVKVNVNTELRQRWFQVMRDHAPGLAKGSNLLKLQEELESAIHEVVDAKLAVLRAE